jgi:LacI family transcriptional regulator
MSMTLKTLARHLGLSPTTVSRALNGYPEVNEQTRERVVNAARKANYHPNMRAKSLATGQAQAIGHVIPVSNNHEIMTPVFADFIAGAGEVYARAGYDMIISVVSDENEEQAYRDMKARGSVDGVLVHGTKMFDRRIALLNELQLPFLVHGRASGIELPYTWLDVNNQSAFRRATDFLLDLGHRRIGLINGVEEMDFAMRRRAGYLEALHARGLREDPAYMHSSEMTESQGFKAVRAMLELPEPPTAFLVSSIISAIGLRRATSDAGLKLGRDISVITHDDELSYLRNGEEVPLFTATRSSVRQAGREAAEMLLRVVANPSLPPQHRLLEAVLTVGQSTGPAPQAANPAFAKHTATTLA